eukprot:3834750-Amphidinium_carterae.1
MDEAIVDLHGAAHRKLLRGRCCCSSLLGAAAMCAFAKGYGLDAGCCCAKFAAAPLDLSLTHSNRSLPLSPLQGLKAASPSSSVSDY